MANTERVKTLRRAREASKEVSSVLSKKKLDPDQEKLLRRVTRKLEATQDALFVEDLSKRVKKLEKDSAELVKLSKDMNKSIKGLKGVSRKVDKAARGVKIMADIATKAAGL